VSYLDITLGCLPSFAESHGCKPADEGEVGTLRRRIYPTGKDVRNVIRPLGITSEKTRKLKAEELVDDRFVGKLEKEGRFQREFHKAKQNTFPR
jgi:hypothetical protein